MWLSLIAGAAGLLVARNLSSLQSAPAGLYVDESSIGYNAFAIARHGVDEHGATLPLYFEAFGEYKNPIYIYTLSALLKLAPLTVTMVRLPAALFGLAACLFLTLIAWQRSRSLPLVLVVLVVLAFTPWLTVESRLGFEVISMVALVSAALWCLCMAQEARAWWHVAAGCCLGLAVYAYSTGRVAVGLFAVALVAAHLWASHRRGWTWLWALPPIAAAYGLLGAWSLAHPGALQARFNLISIAADGAGPFTVAGRFIANYATYFGPDFLFVSGDHNVRHNTQVGGMLLAITLPLLIAGLVQLWRARAEPWSKFVLIGLLLAPVSAALTNESVPHSLRAAVMLPFLMVVAIEGLGLLAALVPRARLGRLLIGLSAAALVVQGTLFTVDLFGTWPARAAAAFDDGELEAISTAVSISGAQPVLLSTSLDQPYIQAALLLRPEPPAQPVDDDKPVLLAEMHLVEVNPLALTASPGSILVLAPADPVPAGAQHLFDEVTPSAALSIGSPPPRYVTAAVFRLR